MLCGKTRVIFRQEFRISRRHTIFPGLQTKKKKKKAILLHYQFEDRRIYQKGFRRSDYIHAWGSVVEEH